MRTISLRRFNAEVGTLREAVEIVRRETDGTLARLGTFVPHKRHAPPTRVPMEELRRDDENGG